MYTALRGDSTGRANPVFLPKPSEWKDFRGFSFKENERGNAITQSDARGALRNPGKVKEKASRAAN